MGEIVVRLIQADDLPEVVPGIIALYREAGWFATDEQVDQEQVEQMLRNSFRVMGAFAEGKIIGLMRALSDGLSDAYLLDMVVSRKYRRQGIAARILQALVEELKKCKIDWIVCISVPGKDGLYAKLGTPMQAHIPYRFL
ncbi:MAG: GNAT family N-acetyltransferase [Lentisphaerae bacterium]|jgi:ribosomal protein S18 acetylase RimI-like enzyme|nr:GNAT family N-acetyltransferase [Lentisphaerota bacterium]